MSLKIEDLETLVSVTLDALDTWASDEGAMALFRVDPSDNNVFILLWQDTLQPELGVDFRDINKHVVVNLGTGGVRLMARDLLVYPLAGTLNVTPLDIE